jgi:nucleotide-binding universal stress UspA family protein
VSREPLLMKILVPVDGSAPANRAVTHAIRMAHGRPNAEIILVNVQDHETLDVSDISAVMTVEADRETAERQSKKALRRAVSLCRKAEVRFETRAEIGPIAETIDRVARDMGADQIVMGARGLGALSTLVLGSVATKVVRLMSADEEFTAARGTVGPQGEIEAGGAALREEPKVCRLFAGGEWIRTSSSGASGEADAFLPVKDRPR